MGSKKRIVITKRDEGLLKYLFMHKGATINQIHRDIFSNSTLRAAYIRTKKLKDYGLIESRSFLDKVHTGVFNVTKIGLGVIFDINEDISHKELKSSNFKHDTTLIDIKNILTKAQCFDFYATENEIEAEIVENSNYPIQAFKDLKSDAALGISHNNEYFNFAVEYENSIKSPNRYYSKLKNYYGYPIIETVLYFTADSKIEKRIIKADKNIIETNEDKHSKIYVTNINKLKEPTKSLKLHNSLGKFFEFNWNKEITL